MSDLYPLKFAPIFREKPWGGRRLAGLGRTLPGDDATRIGEVWELADLSLAGSNGHARPERSVIANGPLAGRKINDVIAQFGEQLLGRLALSHEGEFPLLVKYLDARENLSIQVHPDLPYLARHPEAHLKSEAWYILDAPPGAVVYRGLREGVTPAQLLAAVEAKDEAKLKAMLIQVPVKAGDCLYIPLGTLHALGAGLLVAEVQTPSDTTFRVYDWGRPRMNEEQRRWHLEQAMQCITFGPPQVKQVEKRAHVAGFFTTVSSLIKCDHFHLEKVRMTEGYEQEIPYDQPAVWVVLQGRGKIAGGKSRPVVEFQKGETLLIPANMNDAKVTLAEDTIWLEVTFPQAKKPELE